MKVATPSASHVVIANIQLINQGSNFVHPKSTQPKWINYTELWMSKDCLQFVSQVFVVLEIYEN